MRYRLRSADGREVDIEGGHIVEGGGAPSLTLELGPGELRPGLINAHDHLHRNHYPRLGRPPYPDAYAWGRDIHEHDAETIARARSVDRRDALLFGALKNLLSGVTTVVHHDAWEPAFDDGFPLRVPRVRTIHSLGIEPGLAAHPPGDRRAPLCIHLAEGVTPEMAAEVHEAARLGLVDDSLLAVHAVGADDEAIDRLVGSRVTVVWCPTSNEFLFGRTAPRELLERADVLIGSDSLLTGAGTLLDELRCARTYGTVSDERLLGAVADLAAERLRIGAPRLTPGAPADLVVLDRPVLEATTEDVSLVIVAGVPRSGDERYARLFEHMAVPTARVRVGGASKLIPMPLGAVADRILAQWPDAHRAFGATRS